MVKKQKAKKRPAVYIKGKTEIFHIYMPKKDKLREKVAAKSELLGITSNEFILRVLENNTKDIS